MTKSVEKTKVRVVITPIKDDKEIVMIEMLVNDDYADDMMEEDKDFFLTQKMYWHPEYHAWKFFYNDVKVFQQVIDKIFDGKYDCISELKEMCKKEGIELNIENYKICT